MTDDQTLAAESGPGPRRPTDRAPTPWWTVSTAIALLAGAAWLRDPAVPYLAVCGAATVATVVQTLGRRRLGARVSAIALIGFCALAADGQWTLGRIDRAWPTTVARITSHSTAAMQRELAELAQGLTHDASRALRAPASPADAFRWLAPLARGSGDRGIVLYRGQGPVAWAGRVGAPVDSSGAPFAVVRTPFYVVLQATATRGPDRAIATAVLHADPPGDRLSEPLDDAVASGRMWTASQLRCCVRRGPPAGCRGPAGDVGPEWDPTGVVSSGTAES